MSRDFLDNFSLVEGNEDETITNTIENRISSTEINGDTVSNMRITDVKMHEEKFISRMQPGRYMTTRTISDSQKPEYIDTLSDNSKITAEGNTPTQAIQRLKDFVTTTLSLSEQRFWEVAPREVTTRYEATGHLVFEDSFNNKIYCNFGPPTEYMVRGSQNIIVKLLSSFYDIDSLSPSLSVASGLTGREVIVEEQDTRYILYGSREEKQNDEEITTIIRRYVGEKDCTFKEPSTEFSLFHVLEALDMIFETDDQVIKTAEVANVYVEDDGENIALECITPWKASPIIFEFEDNADTLTNNDTLDALLDIYNYQSATQLKNERIYIYRPHCFNQTDISFDIYDKTFQWALTTQKSIYTDDDEATENISLTKSLASVFPL